MSSHTTITSSEVLKATSQKVNELRKEIPFRILITYSPMIQFNGSVELILLYQIYYVFIFSHVITDTLI